MIVGPPVLIVKVVAPDVPPPGPGLNTVTEAWPADAMSDAEIDARNAIVLPLESSTGSVVRFDPFQRTTEDR